ncbi:hypothetical protein TREES_T100001836 [Tupaia chinensis]|uniref:Uncharacterized protein n=1 Tax=Tupaia chinensis TaxID=246437 RepID=L9KG70_TUPCH|nr:hypothetical protein TREES_T100001836 [Tupaia chinensis]
MHLNCSEAHHFMTSRSPYTNWAMADKPGSYIEQGTRHPVLSSANHMCHIPLEREKPDFTMKTFIDENGFKKEMHIEGHDF